MSESAAPTEYVIRDERGNPLFRLMADAELVYVGLADEDGEFNFCGLTAADVRRAQVELPVFLGAALAEHENLN